MNPKFKLVAALFVLSILFAGTNAFAEEKTKEYHESWAASSIESLEVINKFGEVKVKNEGGTEITIDVVVTVEARDERDANELLEKIDVQFSKNGSTLKAVTSIEKNFKSQRKFSIDYEVNIPSEKNLNISNKYGNTIVNKVTGDADFDVQYGNFTANELLGEKTMVSLAYGKANISSAADLSVEVQYSGMTFEEVGNMKVDSKYSALEIEEGKKIEIESKYDKFEFEEVESVYANIKYSHLRIGELAKELKVESGYGSVKVSQVNAGFESISVTNSYGQISLGLDENYTVDAKCEYCGISYPEDEFIGNRMKENHTSTINGKVGSGSGGKVYIRSRYGEIKLRD